MNEGGDSNADGSIEAEGEEDMAGGSDDIAVDADMGDDLTPSTRDTSYYRDATQNSPHGNGDTMTFYGNGSSGCGCTLDTATGNTGMVFIVLVIFAGILAMRFRFVRKG
jgi:hypothetical protein